MPEAPPPGPHEPGSRAGPDPPERGPGAAGETADRTDEDAQHAEPRGAWSTLLRPNRTQLVVAVLLALLGFATVTEIRANDVGNSYAGYREQDLIQVLNGLTTAQQQAEAELAELRRTRDRLLSDTDARDTAIARARERARQLSILAGTVPVAGPGVTVTIRSDGGEVALQSMLDLVQELRTAGAEAMQINQEVRLVAQSAFQEAPDGISVDDTTLTPPYRVDVIGEPQALSGALTFPRGPVDALEGDGAEVEVTQHNRLEIRAVRVLRSPEYASPEQGQ